jgi:arylsulfate sulfotransferase
MNLGHVCPCPVRFTFTLASVLLLITAGCGSGSGPIGSAVSPSQNPLVAQYYVSVLGSAQVWVEFGPDTNYGRQTSQYSSGPGVHILQILVTGMKASSTYHMRAHAQWADGYTWVDQDHTFTTGVIPSSLTPPTITVSQPSSNVLPAPGVELLSNNGALQSIVTDLKGNIIWFCPGYAEPLKLMQNGHFIVLEKTDLLEIDLACNTIRDVSVAQVNQSLQSKGYDFTIPVNAPAIAGGGQFSHDVLVLPNGHWVAICEIEKSFTNLPGYPGTTDVVGDGVIDIDPNGNVVWGWSAFDHLDVNRHLMGLPDWTHSNALVYTPDGNLLLSMRAQSWILKLDYANGTGSGNVLWKLGYGGDFSLLGGDSSQWFYGQHYPNLLGTNGSQMILAVYDNGNLRIDSANVACGTIPSAPACYSRATIFQVDESTNISSLLWQDLPGFFSFWGGSIGILSNGDVEVDNSEPFFPLNPNVSEITEVTYTNTPQIVWQMTVSGENVYRGYRIPSLYPGITWTQ